MSRFINSIIKLILLITFPNIFAHRNFFVLNMTLEAESKQLFEDFWNWRLRNAPEFATSTGDHDYDDRLDEMSLSSYKRRIVEAKIYLSKVKKLINLAREENISTETTFNLKLLFGDLEQFVNGSKFYSYLLPLNRLEGPQNDFPRIVSWMKSSTSRDLQNIISRFRNFPQQIQEIIVLLKEGLRLGFTMHNVSIEAVPSSLMKIASESVESSQLFKHFASPKPEEISEEVWRSLQAEAKDVIVNEVQPSYMILHDFLVNSYIPFTRSSIAASSLPDGEEYYRACLKFHTTTNLSPKEVHEIGKAEVERITKRMIEIQKAVGFDGSLAEFRDFLRKDPKFRFKNQEEIVAHYQEIAKKISKILPNYFENLPKAKFEIAPVPENIHETMPGAYYFAPPEDGSRPGTFWINTYNATERLSYEAVSLCLHEAEPGHHLQSALTLESGNSVRFRRFLEDRKYFEVPCRFSMNTAYMEGWGLYSEYLGEEMGLYNDPYDLFGRLSHEMLRACRLVVDTGMHALGWNRDDAIKYMLENTASDKQDITNEIDRYITWPGQACGYKIGELKIKELRKKAESKLGASFNLKKFHSLIASMGGVPLDFLELQIDAFIAKSSN